MVSLSESPSFSSREQPLRQHLHGPERRACAANANVLCVYVNQRSQCQSPMVEYRPAAMVLESGDLPSVQSVRAAERASRRRRQASNAEPAASITAEAGSGTGAANASNAILSK